MDSYAARFMTFVLPLLVLCEPVHAATWQVCSLQLRITDSVKHPYPQLQAQVLMSKPASPTVECPPEGATLTFTPETSDYQRTLPRRQWPHKGQAVQVDYRYLDGVCKGDGQSHACRIKHYPVIGPGAH